MYYREEKDSAQLFYISTFLARKHSTQALRETLKVYCKENKLAKLSRCDRLKLFKSICLEMFPKSRMDIPRDVTDPSGYEKLSDLDKIIILKDN